MASGSLADSYVATLVTVKNMDRAVRFYVDTLGAKVLYRGEGEMKDYWASLQIGETEFWLVVPDVKEKRTLAYWTFVVKDIRATVKDLQAKGVKFRKAEKNSKETKIEGPIAVEPFGAEAFFKDTEGNMLMLWQTTDM